jgi:hypothetical protein
MRFIQVKEEAMYKEPMIQEIQDLKASGLTLNEVIDYFANKPGKSPVRKTIRKYYELDIIPDGLANRQAKSMVFDIEPFRSDIIEILQKNPNCYASSIYDVLEERYVEGDQYGFNRLPGNDKTLRSFIHHLKESGAVELGESGRRTYDPVGDTPAGQQMLIDFGQQDCEGGLIVHFICLLLRFSRLLGVFAQDHTFNSEEACRAIYRFFAKCGGRPSELVIDQDSVFVASETFGEVIKTRVFEDFCTEQQLRLWVCSKADPESKGPIENSVKFVKSSFFSARSISSIDEAQAGLSAWTERKNGRIHQATFQIPHDVFNSIERSALRPLLPSVYEAAPLNLIGADVGSMPYMQYKSSKYSLPREQCYSKVYYKAIGEKLHIYDKDRHHLCTHDITPEKGAFKRLDEHKKEPSTEWLEIAERMRSKYNCLSFQHFVNGFKKENGQRHIAKQLRAVEQFLDAECPEPHLVAEIMRQCCEHYRYRFSQFKDVFELCKAKRQSPEAIEMTDVQKRSLASYQKAFEQRCEVA